MLDDLDQDIREHLACETQDNIDRGMSPTDARHAALRKFGNVTLVKEDTHAVWSAVWIEQLWQDLRFGLRLLRKSPGFTVVAVLMLALGIGASTAVFSLVDVVLLKPLPFPQPERIVFPWRLPRAGSGVSFDKYPWGRVDFLFVSNESKTFEALGAFQSDSFNLTGAGEPLRLDGLRASAGFFPSLGVAPALGRTFTEQEDRPGNEREVVLGDHLWRERFGSDPGILGRVIQLNSAPYTVVGVMPRGFDFPHGNEMPDAFTFAPHAELWVPLALNQTPTPIPFEPDELAVVGRLKPGISIDQAQTEVNLLGKRLESQRRNGQGWFNFALVSLAGQVAGDTRRPLLMILAAIGLVLLIACSNVASLLLTRAINRRRELTLRSALGAGSARLLRQLLTESLVLAAAGGMAGIAVAKAAIYVVKDFGSISIPRLAEAGLDPRVLVFALVTTLVTGILFSLAPALAATGKNLVESLKEGDRRTSSNPAAQKTRNLLLISQIALAVVLVVASGLLVRTFYRLLSVDPGFEAAHVLTFELSLPATSYPNQPRIVAVYQEVLRRLRNLPGVQAAGVTEIVPMGGATESTAIRTSDHPRDPRGPVLMANYTMVSPGYFAAAGTPILRGREFDEADTADSVPVTVINSAMAKQLWPGQDPLGRQVAPAGAVFPLCTIVGIAADVKRVSLRESPPPEIYVPYTQKVWPSLLTMGVVVRAAQNPSSLITSVREAVHSTDPNLPIAHVRTLYDIVDDSLTRPRFAVLALGAFGGLAMLLAAVGMYGVISYNVTQRTQEIGIRIALGARRSDVFQMVIAQGARLAAFGIAIGLIASLGMTRLIRNFLFGIKATDPSTFAGVSLLLLGVWLFASYLPARRAMRVDPNIALRHE
jgi:putative ABC transport system permease protein